MKEPKHEKQIIKITKSDLRKAEAYTDNRGCLLATALRRHGFVVMGVVPRRAYTTVGTFDFSDEDEIQIQRSYPGAYSGCPKDEINTTSKPRPNAKPFSIVIRPRHSL